MDRPLLRLPEIAQRTGVPLDTLRHWRWRDDGTGPKTFRLGRRVVAYADDVDRWVEEQASRAQLA